MSTALSGAPETDNWPTLNQAEASLAIEGLPHQEPQPLKQTLIPLIEIEPVREELPELAAKLTKLRDAYREDKKIIHFLARGGIFVWEDKGLWVHDKREHGRDHEAMVRAQIENDVLVRLDMTYENGSGPLAVTLLPGATPPAELISVFEDIAKLQKAYRTVPARAYTTYMN